MKFLVLFLLVRFKALNDILFEFHEKKINFRIFTMAMFQYSNNFLKDAFISVHFNIKCLNVKFIYVRRSIRRLGSIAAYFLLKFYNKHNMSCSNSTFSSVHEIVIDSFNVMHSNIFLRYIYFYIQGVK